MYRHAGGCARAVLVWGGVSRGYKIIIATYIIEPCVCLIPSEDVLLSASTPLGCCGFKFLLRSLIWGDRRGGGSSSL